TESAADFFSAHRCGASHLRRKQLTQSLHEADDPAHFLSGVILPKVGPFCQQGTIHGPLGFAGRTEQLEYRSPGQLNRHRRNLPIPASSAKTETSTAGPSQNAD